MRNKDTEKTDDEQINTKLCKLCDSAVILTFDLKNGGEKGCRLHLKSHTSLQAKSSRMTYFRKDSEVCIQ